MYSSTVVAGCFRTVMVSPLPSPKAKFSLVEDEVRAGLEDRARGQRGRLGGVAHRVVVHERPAGDVDSAVASG